ncbi:hypothetical protein BD770DRAFT_326751, partial [Pilaira anomala]
EAIKDIDMEEAPAKKERATVYNQYSNEDRLKYFYFQHEKLMKPCDAAKAANISYETARKWKRTYNNDLEKNIPFKKKQTVHQIDLKASSIISIRFI